MRAFLLLLALLCAAPAGVRAQAVLRPGDQIEMRLSGMPMEDAAEFTHGYPVSDEGFVNVPHIGNVKAAGLTASQFEQTVRARLIGAKIFNSPTVGVSVPSERRLVTIGGRVRLSQRMTWTNDLTLTMAIHGAGGFDEFGGPKVRLIRGGASQVYDTRKILAEPAKDPALLPGDQVIAQ